MIGKFHIPYGLTNPDPATYCPTNGYIDPTQPNDDFLIIPITKPKYGLLYNWYAATDSRNITTNGWHMPNYSDYTTLATYCGGVNVFSSKLKESGTTYWNINNGTNDFGFNNRGGGSRLSANAGSFSDLKAISEIMIVDGTNYSQRMSFRDGNEFYYFYDQKSSGLSIRLIKNSTALTNGQTGTYIDPSGYVYPTICIGTQEWTSCNIRTQHYRNGDPIPEVTSNSAWTALTTGALCAYNNDWNNV